MAHPRFLIVLLLSIELITACSAFQITAPAQKSSTSSANFTTPTAVATVAKAVSSPYPYTTPLPADTPTILNGLYVKFESDEATPVPCFRCPDYLPYYGLWKLSFDNAVYRVRYPETDWRSIGSFTLTADRITFFNDPNCAQDVGVYSWQLENGALTLKAINDSCSIGLRAINFSRYPWAACQPPNKEAAVTGHWQIPKGCE